MMVCKYAQVISVIVSILWCIGEGLASTKHDGRDTTPSLHNEWVVQFHDEDENPLLFARENNYHYEGNVIGFVNMHRFSLKPTPSRVKRDLSNSPVELTSHHKVKWAERQFSKIRTKRGLLPPERFNDELWPSQWYFGEQSKTYLETLQRKEKPRTLNLNLVKAYDLGYTGQSVKIVIIDDGIEGSHKDLAANYDPDLSFDVNDNDPDPTPNYSSDANNDHGTRCAGEIAMVSNNSICGVGVAYNSKVGAIRMLDGPINDRVEGSALAIKSKIADIVSAAWGPKDDGMTVEGPGMLATQALEEAILKGRNGLGTVFVWASGNGGAYGDDCSCDGYSSHIYTISIGSSSEYGHFPFYGEQCSSVMAVTHSSGANSERQIATTGLNDSCITTNTGTSAAVPLAAGIIALVIEANRNLTWRDVQHLVVWSSNPEGLGQEKDWNSNAVGLLYSNKFGFGLMDAERMVKAARNWITVPNKSTCVVRNLPVKNELFDQKLVSEVLFDANECEGDGMIKYLEHVVVLSNISATLRGAVQVHLTSPSGTSSQLLTSRFQDDSMTGFTSWPFMTTHLWGENPKGRWTLRVSLDKMVSRDQRDSGKVRGFELHLHGTPTIPHHMTLDFSQHWRRFPIIMK